MHTFIIFSTALYFKKAVATGYSDIHTALDNFVVFAAHNYDISKAIALLEADGYKVELPAMEPEVPTM